MERGAPFTVWIPVDAPVPRLPFTRIQGKDLSGSQGVRLLVRLTARTVGMGTEIVDERWFDLDGDDFETGRFVPLQPDLGQDVWTWRGWAEFDGLLPGEGGPRPTAAPGPRPGHPARPGTRYASRSLSTTAPPISAATTHSSMIPRPPQGPYGAASVFIASGTTCMIFDPAWSGK